jgi:pimeloyl-ACP methyl ester carboxylesterase
MWDPYRRQRLTRRTLAVALLVVIAFAIVVFFRPVAVARGFVDLLLRVRGFSYHAVETGSGRVGVIERSGPGIPLFFIHGFLAEARMWAPTLLRMDRDNHLLAMDLPGAGRSDPMPEGMTVRTLAAAAAEVMEQLDIDSATVVGNSLGGWIALVLALEHPERVSGLILVDSAGISFPPPPDAVILPRTVEQFEQAWPWTYSRMRSPPRFFARDVLRIRDIPAAESLLERLKNGSELLDGQLGRIRAPTLVVWGQLDRMIPREVGGRLAKQIKGADYREIPSCGHVPPVECPEDLVVMLEAFRAQHGGGGGRGGAPDPGSR